MSRIEVLGTGLIFRNPKPHLHSRHAYFPSLARLPDGSLTAAFDIGEAFEATNVRSYVSRSTDDGRTWSAPTLIFEPDTSKNAVSTSCRVSHVGDGKLVGLASLMHRPDEQMGLANPETEGFVRTEFVTVASDDAGRTWSAPAPVRLPIDWNRFEICSPIVALPGGRWLLPTSPWPDWSGESPLGPRAMVFVSNDAGRTWGKAVDTMNRGTDRIAFYEQKVVRLTDGRVMSLCWVVDLKTRQNLPNHVAFSSDNADSFTPPAATPLLGETCTPVALPENRVLCVYRRADKRGLWAHLARIEGTTWRPIAEEPLWGTYTASSDSSQPSLMAQMSTLRFGLPTVLRLEGNDLLAAFWCMEDAVSCIRWFRLRIT